MRTCEWTAARENDLLQDCTKPVPWPIFKLGQGIVRLLFWLLDVIIPPQLRLNDLGVSGYTLAMVLRTLADLCIADILKDGPMTAEEIAQRVGEGASAERLLRLLHFSAAHGVFQVEGSSRRQFMRFRNNHLSARLRSDHPNSQRNVLKTLTGNTLADGFNELAWGCKTGGLMFEKTYGVPQFAMLAKNPDIEEVYSRAMTEIDSTCATSVLMDYPWNKYTRFIDVAGAYGSFLASLLQRFQQAHGVLFDQEQVLVRAQTVWDQLKERKVLLDRIEFCGGNFFEAETLPPAHSSNDVFILRQICHDWDDNDTVRILTSVRMAMGSIAATLVLVEAVIIDTPSPTSDPLNRARLLSDVYMMVQHNGKERDQDQWQRLLSAAGFVLTRIVPTRSIFCMVEAKPVAGWLSHGPYTSAGAQPSVKATNSCNAGLSVTAYSSPIVQHEE